MFSPGTPVSSTIDRNNMTEILLNVALNTITHTILISQVSWEHVYSADDNDVHFAVDQHA